MGSKMDKINFSTLILNAVREDPELMKRKRQDRLQRLRNSAIVQQYGIFSPDLLKELGIGPESNKGGTK